MKKFLGFILGFWLVCSVVGSANAAIIIDVTNNNGKAQFTFNGIDQFSTAGDMTNGFWLPAFEIGALWKKASNTIDWAGTGDATFTFGTKTYKIEDIWQGYNNSNLASIGFRQEDHSLMIEVAADESVSISGSFTATSLLYSELNEGTYYSDLLGPSDRENANVKNPITLNVGTSPVPEPATMLLFGIGLLGLAGVNRRKE